MCIHETIQLTQDGSRIIICGDCGREFGQIGRDERETFIAFASKGHAVLVAILQGDEVPADKALGVTTSGNGNYATTTVFPCGECGFLGSCEEGCHT